MAPRVVVFCRLDGSPFDPYVRADHEFVRELRALDRQGIGVVFLSSRTRAELELVQEQLGVRHPFVAENGGAVFMPRGYWPSIKLEGASYVAGFDAFVYGQSYDDVVEVLRRTSERAGIRVIGFSDMSVAEVAAELGLSSLRARLAKLRDYEEPFRVALDDPLALRRLQRALVAEGFHCRPTGRFTQVGNTADIAFIVSELLSLYRLIGPVASIGIGDPRHDQSLLRRVDVSFPSQDVGPAILNGTGALALRPNDAPAIWIDTILEAAGRLQPT